MRILLVDDEKLALMHMERLLINAYTERNMLDQLKELISFQFVSEAIQYAQENTPDVIFLDIQMPEMTGIEAATYFEKVAPHAEIVFVTAYDEFAVKAFELNALDYLLKPVSIRRLEKTLDRLLAASSQHSNVTAVEEKQEQPRQRIYCFNMIRFQVNQGPIEYPRWRTARAKELFAYLLHHRGEFVSKYAIIEMFSPELDQKRAMTQLYTVIYQIRKCLRESNIDIRIENDSIQEGYCLRLENTILDVDEWEQSINSISSNSSQYFDQLETVLYQYEGDYMGNYDYIWAESERERLRQIWMTHAVALVQHLYHTEQWSRLIKLSDKLISFSPFEFEYGIYVMEAYNQLGQYDKLKLFYEKQAQTIHYELQLPLPDDMVEWYDNWLIDRKGMHSNV